MGNCKCICVSPTKESDVIPHNRSNIEIETYYEIGDTLYHTDTETIKKGINIKTKKEVTIHEIRRTSLSQYLFENQVNMLKQLRYAYHVEQFIECLSSKKFLYIITKPLYGDKLLEGIAHKQKYSELAASKLIKQMLLSVKSIHDNNIIHRDIKPDNFIFKTPDNKELVLTNFRTATQGNKDLIYDLLVGTPHFLSPEYLTKKERTLKEEYASDLWCIGIISYMLLCGEHPFDGPTNQDIYGRIYGEKLKFKKKDKKSLNIETQDFIVRLLRKKVRNRMKLMDALNHEFIKLGENDQLNELPLDNNVQLNLNRFSSSMTFKEKVLQMMLKRNDLSDEEETYLREMFDKMDENGDGVLGFDEIANVLYKTDYVKKNDAINRAKQIIKMVDKNEDGTLDYNEFKMGYYLSLSTDDKMLNKMFRLIDIDGDGEIYFTEMKRMLRLDVNDCTQFLDKMDTNNDGVISFDEFKSYMKDKLKIDRFRVGSLYGQGNIISQVSLIDMDKEMDSLD